MKHVQATHCGVYSLLFFQVVSGFLEQFPRTLDKDSFRFRDTIREFGRIELANCGFVVLSPISVLWEFMSDGVHLMSVAVALGRVRGGFSRGIVELLGHNGSLLQRVSDFCKKPSADGCGGKMLEETHLDYSSLLGCLLE